MTARVWSLAALLGPALLLASATALGRDYSGDLPAIPGGYADIGTHRLHYHCRGSGRPTIVIDNGIAGAAAEWYPVQDSLSQSYRTCVYDRAGYGWSEPGPSPRTTRQISAELREMLRAGGESGPFVLVGHSFGGFTAMYTAARFPQEVAAVVLIDSSSPAVMFDTQTGGGAHLLNPVESSALQDSRQMPRSPIEMARFLNSRRKALFAQMDEINNFARSAAQVAAAGTLGDTPVLVVARDPGGESAPGSRENIWRAAQLELARASSHAEVEFALGSDHFIHQGRPDWVAETIRDFLDEWFSAY